MMDPRPPISSRKKHTVQGRQTLNELVGLEHFTGYAWPMPQIDSVPLLEQLNYPSFIFQRTLGLVVNDNDHGSASAQGKGPRFP